MAYLTMKQLLEAGVHFGHQTKRWDPKMKSYIFGARNGIYIIDLQQTVKMFKVAYDFIKGVAANNKRVLFVGTKKEALMLDRERIKLDKYMRGIKDMNGLPGALFVIDVKKESIATKEARKLGIPVVAVVDTNSSPDDIDYVF